MKRRILYAALLALLIPVCAHAQSSAVGITVGSGESLADGLDFSFGDTVYQIYYETDFGGGTKFRVQYGTFDTQTDPVEVDDPKLDTSIEYVNLIGQYEFDEVYGQSALFAGLGLYRSETKGFDDEKDWGLVLGVNGTFPISRRLALTGELAYHWADFDNNLSVLVASGGFKVRF